MEIKNIDVLKVEKVTENTLLMFKVDTGNLPRLKAEEYLDRIKEMVQPIVAPAKVLILNQSVDVTVLEKDRKVFHIDADVPAEKVQEIVDRVKQELGI